MLRDFARNVLSNVEATTDELHTKNRLQCCLMEISATFGVLFFYSVACVSHFSILRRPEGFKINVDDEVNHRGKGL